MIGEFRVAKFKDQFSVFIQLDLLTWASQDPKTNDSMVVLLQPPDYFLSRTEICLLEVCKNWSLLRLLEHHWKSLSSPSGRFSTTWESPVSCTSTPFPWTSHVFNGFLTISRVNHDLNARRNYLSLHLFKQQMFLECLDLGTILYNGDMAVSKTDVSPALRELT